MPVLLPVLNGAFIFAADLVKQLEIPTEISFIKVTSYKNTQSTGKVKQVLGLDIPLEGRDVILLEDIIDSGLTVHTIKQQLLPLKLRSLKVAALFHKPYAAKLPIVPDYAGITIPDKFVVGYGLDYNGLGRNLQGLYILNEG